MTTRTRFAPSPTGHLHAGNARTALFNYLFARANGGTLILRIDDSDEARSSAEFEAAILKDLNWLGITWDEGEGSNTKGTAGTLGPYRQSLRKEIYETKAEELLDSGKAYHCYCSVERLEELKKVQLRAKRAPRYDNLCRDITEIPSDTVPVIRFRVPDDDEVSFTDAVHGEKVFLTKEIGDFIITSPKAGVSYNFATSVDDALMRITDVIRGDDHLSNTPRQILLIDALGGAIPRYAHLPLVLGEDKKPLSKRNAGASIAALRAEGYLPEALVNAIANLGWAVGGYKSLKEMVEGFTLKRISKSASVFNIASLKDFNKHAIEHASLTDIIKLIEPSFPNTGTAELTSATELARIGALSIADIVELLAPLLSPLPAQKPEARAMLSESEPLISDAIVAVNNLDTLDDDSYKVIIDELKAKGYKGKLLFKPLRIALTGRAEGMELKDVMKILGKTEVVKRLGSAIKET